MTCFMKGHILITNNATIHIQESKTVTKIITCCSAYQDHSHMRKPLICLADVR